VPSPVGEVPRHPEKPTPSRSLSDILQLNKDLQLNLQAMVDEHDSRKKELDELRFNYDQAQGEIVRLREELKHSQARDAQRVEQLRQLEQERVDQLGAMHAHLDALRAAVDRYLQQGRKAA
jgi:predicted nuclease with TOPRIM domain